MKTHSLSFIISLSMLMLNACGGGATPSAERAISDVNTSVALTLTAQGTPIAATATLLPVSSPTPMASPTQIPRTPTHQNVPATSNVSACDNAAWNSDVTIPDGTILAPGETFVKTWEFQNTGSCTWSEDYSITHVSGDVLGGSTTTIDQTVTSGALAEISISLTAPIVEGTYTGNWRLMNEEGTAFGVTVWVKIIVSENAWTQTPTPTATSGASSTPTSTPEDTFTPTMESPTDTATPTETPT